ncbi:MAG: chromosomal replication initiator protein DnaA, partial [Calditrichia bacterium]
MSNSLEAARTSHENMWNESLEIIRENINPRSYQTWFAPLKAVSVTDNSIILSVPNKFFCEWLDNHYLTLLKNAVAQVAGQSLAIRYEIMDQQPYSPYTGETFEPEITSPKPVTPRIETNLNAHYNFENFIVGDGTRFAHAAASAVADSPGSTNYNPLIIYGGTGLGKTHLIQAIGNKVRNLRPELKVYYTSSESFTSHFISSIQQNKAIEFSTFYRSCDILIIDDIQFFNNKGKTQEEFFHTFNELHQKDKQIVLTSDRPIAELGFLEERLVSRFQWGLIADIQPPDLETRIAILRKKCEENELEMSNDIIEYLAVNLVHNVRELEGALTRLFAQVLLTQTEPTIDVARSVVAEIGKPKTKQLTIEQIIQMTAKHYNVPEERFMKKDRKKHVALARQVAMYLSVELTNHSTVNIGLHFGGRDHTTVIYAHRMINQKMGNDKT